jgi:hypothetical protein
MGVSGQTEVTQEVSTTVKNEQTASARMGGFILTEDLNKFLIEKYEAEKEIGGGKPGGMTGGIMRPGAKVDTKNLFKLIVEKNKGEKKQVFKDLIEVIKMTHLQNRRRGGVAFDRGGDLGPQAAV